uniref:Uncharacterized protein n=1 Tax=Timema cristinae TaxID=61476 RepID=A0A7R9D089_TIMCR|nr:unnamed protein product [Timema cristinae]
MITHKKQVWTRINQFGTRERGEGVLYLHADSSSSASCPSGSADAILALVNAGANVESEDKDGLTVCSGSQPEMCCTSTALHCAASRGHTDCLETLVSLCGAEVDVIDTNGCTALFYAVTLGHADSTQLLLTYGAEPNRQDRKGRTPPRGPTLSPQETSPGPHRGTTLAKATVRPPELTFGTTEATLGGRADMAIKTSPTGAVSKDKRGTANINKKAPKAENHFHPADSLMLRGYDVYSIDKPFFNRANGENLVLMNTGTQTHFSNFNGVSYVNDLNFRFPGIFTQSLWEIHIYLCDSDHYPILLPPLHHSTSIACIAWATQLVVKHSNWNKLRDLALYDGVYGLDVNVKTGHFTSTVIMVVRASIPLFSPNPHHRTVPWWN